MRIFLPSAVAQLTVLQLFLEGRCASGRELVEITFCWGSNSIILFFVPFIYHFKDDEMTSQAVQNTALLNYLISYIHPPAQFSMAQHRHHSFLAENNFVEVLALA